MLPHTARALALASCALYLSLALASPESCTDSEEAAMLQSAKVVSHRANSSSAPPKCFQAYMETLAGLDQKGFDGATGWTMFEVNVGPTSGSVSGKNMWWQLPLVNAANPVIGIHIHKGQCSDHGPILVGFCGEDPLPAFGGPCDQGGLSDTRGSLQAAYNLEGAACDVRHSQMSYGPSPCVDTTGTQTIEDAAKILYNAEDIGDWYLNVHTVGSYHANGADTPHGGPWGLICGQLRPYECTS